MRKSWKPGHEGGLSIGQLTLSTARSKWRLDGPGLSGHYFIIICQFSLCKYSRPSSSPIIGQRCFNGAEWLSYSRFYNQAIRKFAGHRKGRSADRSILNVLTFYWASIKLNAWFRILLLTRSGKIKPTSHPHFWGVTGNRYILFWPYSSK